MASLWINAQANTKFSFLTVSGSVGVTEAVVPSLLRTRYRREARQPDEEEEMWFNDDDELEDEAPLDAATPHPHPHAHHALDAIGMCDLRQFPDPYNDLATDLT